MEGLVGHEEVIVGWRRCVGIVEHKRVTGELSGKATGGPRA